MAERRDRPSRPDVDGDVDVVTERKTKPKLQRPRQYKVLLHNDDYTTMEFVVLVLVSIFHRTEGEAVQIMLHVHRNGVGVAGVYTHEVAETRVEQVHALARRHEYPLRASLEEA
jgi:ATP-dependent Clp protease adaptor protein ClpS